MKGNPVLLQLLQQLRETTHPATTEIDGVQSGQFNRRFVRREISPRDAPRRLEVNPLRSQVLPPRQAVQ